MLKRARQVKRCIGIQPNNWNWSKCTQWNSAPSIASIAFSTLFANDVRDPMNWSTIRSISDNDIGTFAAKLKYLVKFAEKIEGTWHCWFASHPRFGYWAYNILYRKWLLSQGKFYMKQHFGALTLTIDEQKLFWYDEYDAILSQANKSYQFLLVSNKGTIKSSFESTWFTLNFTGLSFMRCLEKQNQTSIIDKLS